VAQTVFFTPHLVAGVSAGFIWGWLMSSQPYGLFNTVFNALGLSSVRWLDDSSTAMFSIVLMNTWKNVGYYCLIIMSAMKSIPTEIYESARLDGSSAFKTFFKITIPMISPQLFFLLITITTGSFKVFDSVRIMTNGGPGDATRVLSMYIYDYAFERNNTLGYACAAGILMMLLMVAVTVFDFGFVEKKVHYQ
ncbi:MAG: sugar ABC transporter permease, partial [Clostridia bacterium]|nr:sugar ABC transporter permease [Clostridia bacterium]